MNLDDIVIELLPDGSDYRVWCNIKDENGNQIGSFGPSGILLLEWWRQQSTTWKDAQVSSLIVSVAQSIMGSGV